MRKIFFLLVLVSMQVSDCYADRSRLGTNVENRSTSTTYTEAEIISHVNEVLDIYDELLNSTQKQLGQNQEQSNISISMAVMAAVQKTSLVCGGCHEVPALTTTVIPPMLAAD